MTNRVIALAQEVSGAIVEQKVGYAGEVILTGYGRTPVINVDFEDGHTGMFLGEGRQTGVQFTRSGSPVCTEYDQVVTPGGHCLGTVDRRARAIDVTRWERRQGFQAHVAVARNGSALDCPPFGFDAGL